jgi:penicillin-binding protein 1A
MPLKEDFVRFRTYILRFWALVGGGLLLFTGYMFALSLSKDIPDVVELQNPRSFLATEVYAADGALLGSYYRENRSNATYQELPQHLVDALIATEDVRFRSHAGIDLRALLRVVKGLVTFNTGQGGGSTLTQQLAKNLYPRDAGLSTIGIINRKFKEWILAARLEKNFTKDEILVLYLNTVPFMYDAYGVKSCAKTYFAKEVSDLSIEEAAAIVGMLQNPSLYNPVRRPERTRERRNVVLAQMHHYGYLEKAQKDSLQLVPLDVSRFTRQDHNAGMATYFREQLRQWMKDWCEQNRKPDGEPYDIYKDGLRIYTTIDSRMQGYAEEAMETWLTKLQDDFFKHWNKDYKYEPWTYPYNDRKDPEFLTKKMKQSDRYRSLRKQKMPEDSIALVFNTPIPMTVFSWHGNQNHELDTVMSPLDSIRYHRKILHAGLLALDPETGFIRAWVGGISHRHFKLDHVNKGTRRQVGSTFKPFIYTAALQAGYYPCQQVPNVPVTFQAGDPRFGLLRSWTPKNSSHDREGQMVTLYWALANSVNFISAFLMDKIGTQPVVDMAHKMGIEADIPNQPSICLGTPEISLYEMVGAYTIFANQGGYTEPVFISRIEDKNGVILYENFGANSEEVMKPQDAYVMLNMLQNVMQYGTGQRIRRSPYGALPGGVQIAGKTGTTQQHTDGWFMGLVPNLVGGVWVGADDPVVAFRSIGYGQGANMALPIYGNFLRQVLENGKLGVQVSDRFPVPDQMDIELNCSEYQTPGSGDEGEDPYLELDR